MRVILLAAVAALAAGCGPSAPSKDGGGGTDTADVCALVNAAAVFGRAMESEADPGFQAVAGGCRWRAADGAVIGDAALYTEASRKADPEAVSAAALFQKLAKVQQQTSEIPAEPVAGLGDEAVRVVSGAGDQTQITLRAGEDVIVARAASADPKLDGAALAEKLARALAEGRAKPASP